MNLPTVTVSITGGTAVASTAVAARIRAQAAAGLPSRALLTDVHDHGVVDEVSHGEGTTIPAGRVLSVYSVTAETSLDRMGVWACLVWGYASGRLFVAGIDGDTRGGVLEQSQRVIEDLGLVDAGVALDGVTATTGKRGCVTVAAVSVARS
jgi:hypothetical protein